MLLNVSQHLERTDNLLNKSYRGVVVDNEDPLKLGRIKVTVTGLLEGDTENLPWVSQRSSAMLGGQPDVGSFFVPILGSELEIIFPHKDIYAGFYVGFWQTPDTHNSTFDSGYPNKYGFVDSGFIVSYDNDAKEFIIEHPEGAKITMKPDGSVDIETPSKVKIAGKGGTEIGDGSSITEIKGSKVMLADGGPPVARHGDAVVGGTQTGGAIVGGTIIATSTKVMAG